MRFYNQSHAFYCGVDLHARSMFTHVLDHQGATVFAKDLPANPSVFLYAVAPFRNGLVVGCECMFAWYWLADLCEDESIPFTLGHALYMKAIHGGKAKNDRIDAAKIAAWSASENGTAIPSDTHTSHARPHSLGLAPAPWTEVLTR
jgi:transposase